MPSWDEYEPYPPNVLGRMFGGERRHNMALEQAKADYELALQSAHEAESERRRRLDRLKFEHEKRNARIMHEAESFNASIDDLARRAAQRERKRSRYIINMSCNHRRFLKVSRGR